MSIKIENTVTLSAQQWEAVIRGMRNPKNSWHLSDSYATHIEDPETGNVADFEYFIGENDQKLMETLAKGGPVHAKYRRMIFAYVDIVAPLYFFKEMDTYKVGTVCNSCSTMHKIQAKEFTLDDFSHEHMTSLSLANLQNTINLLNIYRNTYLYGGEDIQEDGSVRTYEPKNKDIWWQMIQLLPSSYNQRRTYLFSYEALVGVYRWRKDHKLDEWHIFCDWIKNELPYSELITGECDKTVIYDYDIEIAGDVIHGEVEVPANATKDEIRLEIMNRLDERYDMHINKRETENG